MGNKQLTATRVKDDTRRNILDKALCIIQTDGCDALSMRKLADQIDYTAPMIYEYFKNKEGIYQELARRGYLQLTEQIKLAKQNHLDAESQMMAMWIAYWDFAWAHQTFYRLMYGVNVACCAGSVQMPEAGFVAAQMLPVIRQMYGSNPVSDKEVQVKYFTYWSVIHGLIAINLIQRNISDAMDQQILVEAIRGITQNIKTEVQPRY